MILYEVRDGAAHITINRADKYNGYCQVVDSRLCFPVKGVDHAVISAV